MSDWKMTHIESTFILQMSHQIRDNTIVKLEHVFIAFYIIPAQRVELLLFTP